LRSRVPDQQRLSRDELADRSGASPAYLDQLIAAGILVPDADGRFSATDPRRVGFVEALTSAGLPIDALGELFRRGSIDLGFIDDPVYEQFAALTDTTFRQLSQRTEIPLEVALAIREAAGSGPAEPGDRVRANELDAVPVLQLMLRQGVPATVVERALRAYGESLRRIAEVQTDWFMADVIRPLLAQGGLAASLTPQISEFSRDLGPQTDQLLLALLHAQQGRSWMRGFFEGFETELSRAGIRVPVARPPAICFLDLSGYTRLTEERGDAAAAELAARLSRLAQGTSARHGGKPVKWLGDGVMFHFPDPGPAVLAALEMVDGARDAELPPAHVGLHAGPVLFQDGDYFGRTVNIAARIADYARRGEVLVSDEVVAAGGAEGVAFDPIGPVELKGLTEAVPLHVARRST